MANDGDLRRLLQRIDGKGYGAYKDIRGRYEFGQFQLFIDYVQGDPFASPSRLRVQVPQRVAGYPASLFGNRSRRIGTESYIGAAFGQACTAVSGRSGSGKSGMMQVDAPGQEMLKRTAVSVTEDYVEARFFVGLPARGRRVLGRTAAAMLCDDLPKIVEAGLMYKSGKPAVIKRFADASEDADALRAALVEKKLVAFVAEGAVLPRRSGVDNRPLRGDGVIAFRSPDSLRVAIELPNAGTVEGMGIPAGVTLIVGGGFHGKSTLLNALERGVYNHRPNDGRELVITNEKAVKIRAEDGRSVAGVNITPFINNLPYGQTTDAFSSDNASGSTSQAANIIEALALGSELLLIDEDTAATNFMIRDRRMQALIAKEKEPITPFIDKVRQLYEERGVSTILVIGGSGDYFEVADRVIAMDGYVPREVTAEAKAIAAEQAQARRTEGGSGFGELTPRIPLPRSIDPRKGRRESSVKTRGLRTVQFGTETIDLSAVGQLVDDSQTRAIGVALLYAKARYVDGKRPLSEIVALVMRDIEREGLDVLDGRLLGDLAEIRPFELAAALNRLRTLRVK